MDAQLRKGLLEFCVLAALREKDSYGYQIIRDISEYIDISESTLYPILRRLEADSKVESYNTEFNNRIRKYYKMTDVGVNTLNKFISERNKLFKVLDYISGGNGDE